MKSTLKTTLAVAALTATVGTIGAQSLMPSPDRLEPERRQVELMQQYRRVKEAEDRERRRILRLQTDTRLSEARRGAEIRQSERRLDELSTEARALRSRASATGGNDAARRAARGVLRP